jgi:protein-disulfide isomerase
MNRLQTWVVAFAIAVTLPSISLSAMAQQAVPPGTGDTFKDTSMIKPPAGARVAIYEFMDLECPACAHAYPIVHAAAAHFNIPLVQRDFPLSGHIWSFDAAIWARYLQDKVSPAIGEQYRGAVFAAQLGINSKDDLLSFTRNFFQSHGQQLPFVPDPTGQLTREVQADKALGEKMGLQHTPTLFVCTQHEWTQVTNVSMLYQTISEVEAQAAAEAPEKPAGLKKASVSAKKSQ